MDQIRNKCMFQSLAQNCCESQNLNGLRQCQQWKFIKINTIASSHGEFVESLESMISDWAIMKRVVAWILKYNKILISRIRQQSSNDKVKRLSLTDLNVSLLEDAQ